MGRDRAMAANPMRISLRGKLGLGFTLSGLTAFIVLLFAWHLLSSLRVANQQIELTSKLVQLGLECRLVARANVPGRAMHFPAELLEQLVATREAFEAFRPKERASDQQAGSPWQVLSQSLDDMAAAIPRPRPGQPVAAAELRLFEFAAENVQQQAAALHDRLSETAIQRSKAGSYSLVIVALVGLALTQMVALLVIRSIVEPVQRCYASAMSLCPAEAAGASDAETVDELAQLNDLINQAADSTHAKLSSLEEENSRLRTELATVRAKQPGGW